MKRIVMLLICLALLIPGAVVHAAGSTTFLNFYEIVEDTLYLYGTELPQGGDVTVSVDSQVITNVNCTSVADEKLPITVYCLVDITSDMTDEQVQQQKDILSTISSRLGPDDSMVIATVGSDFSEGQPLETQEARNTAIDTLRRKGKIPHLYDAVIKAVQSMETKKAYSTNRCLVILADGFNDSEDGIKEQQVWDCIQESAIPVYGIAIVKQYSSAYALKYANNVVRMGQESVGGFGIDPVNDEMSAASAAESVWVAIQNGTVFAIPLDQVDSRSNNASISVTYETKESRFEDCIAVSLVSVPVAETESTEETEETQTSDEDAEEGDGINPVILIGAVFVLIIITGVIIASRRRNAAKEKEKDTEKSEEVIAEVIEIPDNVDQYTDPMETQPVLTQTMETQKEDVLIRFVAILHSDVVCTFGLTTHVAKILGRSKKADVCLNSEDIKLSGQHCIVEWDGTDLYMKDIGSTNGTSLNGVPIKPNVWYRLPEGSKVRMGEYEYRITIEKS